MPDAIPSMVVMLREPTSMAKVMQESVGTLSIQTVQAEHDPRSQTTLVPVRLSESRRASASVMRGSTGSGYATPFTWSTIGTAPGPEVCGLRDDSFVSLATACKDSARVLAAVTLAAFKNPRREIDGFSFSDKQHILWPSTRYVEHTTFFANGN